MMNDPTLDPIDALIDSARTRFRAMVLNEPTIFGGVRNPRLRDTLAPDAPYGTVAMAEGIDHHHAAGLMAGVDLTLLDMHASGSDIEQLAQRAKQEGAATVCVYPQHIAQVRAITHDHPPAIAVVGFPSVADPQSALMSTLAQTRRAIQQGAKEIDMVLARNFKDHNPDYAAHYHYLSEVVAEARKHNVGVKVILETAYLTDTQKVEACLLAKLAGATFVKTSTGFADEQCMRAEIPDTQKGATPHDVALMRRSVGDTTVTDQGSSVPMGVKASGGIRNRDAVLAMYEAGASRIGASMGLDVRSVLEKHVLDRAALIESPCRY